MKFWCAGWCRRRSLSRFKLNSSTSWNRSFGMNEMIFIKKFHMSKVGLQRVTVQDLPSAACASITFWRGYSWMTLISVIARFPPKMFDFKDCPSWPR